MADENSEATEATPDASADQSTGDSGATDGDGGKGSTLLDFAPKGEAKDDAAPEQWEPPEGLTIPDHLRGESADDTLAKMTAAYMGARKELSLRGKGKAVEANVPEDITGYQFQDTSTEETPDLVFAELTSEESAPIVDAFKQAALDLKIDPQTFSDLMRKGMEGAAESGLSFGMNAEQQAQISGEAEFQALSDRVGRAEAGEMMRTVSGFEDQLAERGVLPDDNARAAFREMVGTADALEIFHRMMVAELGVKPIPHGEGATGEMDASTAYAAYSNALAMPDGAAKEAAIRKAEAAMEKAFPGNSTGTFKSRAI